MTDLSGVRTSLAGIRTVLGVAQAAKVGSTIQVDINGTITTIQAVRDITFAANDVVLIERVGSQWFATGRVYTAAPTPSPDNDPPPPPKPVTVYGTLTVPPVETRSYRDGRWRTDDDDVRQGQYGGYGNHTGAVFYGSKPLSLDGATVLGATLRVRRNRGGAYAATGTTMRLMTQRTKPAGSATLTSTSSGPSLRVDQTDDSFDLPTAWVQAMVDGTAGGLAFFDGDGSPYVVFAGRGSWSPAFTLTIRWRRG